MEKSDKSLGGDGKIVACIPAFNSGNSIYDVVRKTQRFVDHIIVIDDGSTDDTGEQALLAGAEVIRHPVNLGYGSAISTSLKAGARSGARIVITLDADMQHNPEEIPILVQPIMEGISDIVTGSRFVLENESDTLPTYRRIGITLLTKVTNFMAQTSISDATTGFRAYSNSAARILASTTFSPGMGASSQILMEALRSGLRVKEVPVNISYETGFDTSTQNPVQMGVGILTSIIRYIAIRRPLSMIGIPGLVVLSVGAVGVFLLLGIFNTSRMIPTGLAMLTVATSVIGLVLLLGSLFLYSLSTMSKQIMERRLQAPNTTSVSIGSKKTSIIRFIAIRRPLSMIGIPGLVVLSVGAVGVFLLLGIFNTSRMIPTGLAMLTVATSVIGLILLMTSVILYTMSKFFNSKTT